MAVRCAQLQVLEIPVRITQRVRNPRPDPDHLDAALHLGGDGTTHISLEKTCHRLGIHPLQGCPRPIDMNLQCVAGGIDTVTDLDNPLDPFDFCGDASGRPLQLLHVV